MKLPRNARVFQGQLDVAPFAGIFFLLLMFVLYGSALVHSPGIQISLADVPNSLPGPATATIAVSIDRRGRIYFENQAIREKELLPKLKTAVANAREPLSLMMQVDQQAPLKTVVRVLNDTRSAGLAGVYWAATSL